MVIIMMLMVMVMIMIMMMVEVVMMLMMMIMLMMVEAAFAGFLINVSCFTGMAGPCFLTGVNRNPYFPMTFIEARSPQFLLYHVNHVVKNWKYTFPVTKPIQIHSHCIVIHSK